MGLNPQQLTFKENYTNPNSETFGNATASAIAAGYGKEYAEVMMAPSKETGWIEEIFRDYQRLQKAEKVLDKVLEMEPGKDNDRLRIQVDVGKFVAKGMGKAKYSERQETSGPDGGPININLSGLDDDRLEKLIEGIQAQVGRTSHRETEENTATSSEVREAPQETA